MLACNNNLPPPKRVLECTFDFLSPKDLSRCASVCKIWNAVANQERLWKKFITKEQQFDGLNKKIFINQKKIQKSGNFYDHPSYFDDKGFIHDIKVGSSSSFDPQPLKLLLVDGRIVQLFVANNPWRAPSNRDSKMVYQFCVFCKHKRFESELFNSTEDDFETVTNILRIGGGRETLFTCQKLTCQAEKWFDFADNVAQDKFYATSTFEYISQLPKIIAQDQSEFNKHIILKNKIVVL